MREYMISDRCGNSAAILPEKGATVVSFKKQGVEYLYRDDENLLSDERPRCGIPFLFPIFGRLKDGAYNWNGARYAMAIHGFAHTSVWQVLSHQEDSLKLLLESNADTRVQYPFEFRVTLTFTLRSGVLTIAQTYENRGDCPMPYNYGFHPYFLTEKPEQLLVEATAATRFDFAAGPAPFGHGAFRLAIADGAPEAGTCFMNAQSPAAFRSSESGKSLTMNFDESFNTLVLWAQAGKPFLCIEPVNGGADTFNNGAHMTLAPGEIKEAAVSFC